MKKITKTSKKISIKKPKKITIKNKNINNKNNNIFINSSEELKESYKKTVDNNNYYDFLEEFLKKGYITKCVKENINFWFKEKEHIYPYPNSNIQFVTYVKNSLNNKDYGDLAKLQAILTKYISFDFSFKVISYITKNKNKNIKDVDIINFILDTNKINNIKSNIVKLNPKQCKIIDFMTEQLTRQIKGQLEDINKNNQVNIKNIKFCDIGCEHLDFSHKIFKILDISNNNFYGLYDSKYKLFSNNNFIKKNIDLNNFIKINNISKLPFEDNYFDFLFAHSFLQKVNDFDLLVSELNRILKPNGFILLISIMTLDRNDNLLCDIINTLNNVIIKKINIEDYIKNPEYMRYFNYVQWDFVMKKHNFKYVKQNILYGQSKESITQNNGMNFAIYQVKKNINS